jgi:hypothetical protein
MVKNCGGVAMLKDVTDWRPPRRHDGAITLSPPAGSIPSRLLSELPERSAPASEAPLPRVSPGSPGAQYARGYNSGVVTGADCRSWVPPKPQGGLIVEGRWIDRPRSSEAAAPPEDDSAAAGATRNGASAGAEPVNWRIIG